MSGYYSTTDGRHIFRLLDGERTNGYSGPYVVIDPEDREAVERLHSLYESLDKGVSADDMQAALREFANPKPPKPDEPQGLGAVVEDEKGRKWTRAGGAFTTSANWLSLGSVHYVAYSEIAAVRVLSPGVEVDQ